MGNGIVTMITATKRAAGRVQDAMSVNGSPSYLQTNPPIKTGHTATGRNHNADLANSQKTIRRAAAEIHKTRT